MNSVRTLWRNGAVTNVSVLVPYHAVDSLLVFLYTMLIARGLGVAPFGLFVTAVSIGAMLFLLLDFGCTLAVVRDVASGHPINSALKSSIWIRAAIVSALGLAALAGPLGLPLSRTVGLFLLLAASEGLRSVQVLAQAALLGQKRPVAVSVVNATEKIGILLPVAASIWLTGTLSLEATALSFLAGRLVSGGAAVVLARPIWRGGRISPHAAVAYAFSSRHLGLFLVSERSLAYSLPILLTLSAGIAATAQFQAAFKIVLLPISFFTSFASAVYPVVAGMKATKPHELRSGISYGFVATLVFAAGCGLLYAFAANPLVILVFGEAYQPAATILLELVPVILLSAMWQFSLYVLTALGQDRIVLRSSALATFSIAGLVLLLGSLVGMHAAPLALIAGFSLSAFNYIPALLRHQLLDVRLVNPSGLAAAVVLSASCVFTAQWLWPREGLASILFTAFCLLLLFPVGLILFRVVRTEWLRAGSRGALRRFPSAWTRM